MLDGVYRRAGEGKLRFVAVPAPGREELLGLVQRIAERIGRSLEHSGLITRDIENAYPAFDPVEEAPTNSLLGASIPCRIATGPREGRKVFTLQTRAGALRIDNGIVMPGRSGLFGDAASGTSDNASSNQAMRPYSSPVSAAVLALSAMRP